MATSNKNTNHYKKKQSCSGSDWLNTKKKKKGAYDVATKRQWSNMALIDSTPENELTHTQKRI